jgi:hypothetical protein
VKTFSLVWLLLFAAADISGAQEAVRLDSARLLPGARYGTWSATNGNIAFMGTWTAVPDTMHGSVTGTWTLMDKAGKTAAFGGWSAAKTNGQWAGAWRANATGRTGEYSGTWTSAVDLKTTAGFADLFEKAVQTIVSGMWSGAGQSGAWSIRAAKK